MTVVFLCCGLVRVRSCLLVAIRIVPIFLKQKRCLGYEAIRFSVVRLVILDLDRFGLIRTALWPLMRMCGVLIVLVRLVLLLSSSATIWASVSWTCLSLLAFSISTLLRRLMTVGVTTDWTCLLRTVEVVLLGRRLLLFTTPPRRTLALGRKILFLILPDRARVVYRLLVLIMSTRAALVAVIGFEIRVPS